MHSNIQKIGPKSAPGSLRVLILQGPVGPFFRDLSEALIKAGAEVTQVTFNQGDNYYGLAEVCVPVNGSLADFRETVSIHLDTDIDVVVLFGSQRPAHKVARNCCAERGIPVLSFEEGYIRPGTITCEVGGNNATSPLARMDFNQLEHGASTRITAANYRGFWPMVWYGANYYVRRETLSNIKARSFSHRETPIAEEVFYWCRNVFRKIIQGNRHKNIVQSLIDCHAGDYFIVPLQVPSDSNIKEAANGWTTPKLIHELIKSFSANAPESSQLVFKIHPMSRGHSSDHKLIYNLATTYRIGSRTHVIHTGSLGELTKSAAGMITINSTSGLSAIHHGIPLLTMGKSIFAHPEITRCAIAPGSIDKFWKEQFVAHEHIRKAYLAHVRKEALLPGDFYAQRGRRKAVNYAVAKIMMTARQSREKEAC